MQNCDKRLEFENFELHEFMALKINWFSANLSKSRVHAIPTYKRLEAASEQWRHVMDPHAIRQRIILKKHPEIKKLFVYESLWDGRNFHE